MRFKSADALLHLSKQTVYNCLLCVCSVYLSYRTAKNASLYALDPTIHKVLLHSLKAIEYDA